MIAYDIKPYQLNIESGKTQKYVALLNPKNEDYLVS